MPGKLSAYHAKRNFQHTAEPRGEIAPPSERPRFVVQKHDARRLHYDFRLEIDGTLKSWAVPKGPSLDPAEKRLAVHVEDHPLDYIDFEGDIPAHQYGAGHVDVWDTGYWEPQGDASAGYRAGKLKFLLHGEKLHGGWTLVRTRLQASGDKEQWLLIKERDDEARRHDEFDVTQAAPGSVLAKAPEKAGDRADRPAADGERRPLPKTLSPQLATLVDEVPKSGDWIYEVKFDGYRLLARIDGDDVRLLTRDGKDWTARLPQQADAVRALGMVSGWLDGEIVVLDHDGMPSFQLLQRAFDQRAPASIVYFLFDLPYCDGEDLRGVPLEQRRARLADLLEGSGEGVLRFSAAIEQPPQQLLDSACRLALEGIIGKRRQSLYTGKRSSDWIKLKCRQRQEFVIAGYTEPQGSRKFFGALLLAVYDGGRLRYAGRVGTGFDRQTLLSVHRELAPLRQRQAALDELPGTAQNGDVHWVRPQLVAEISFAEWTHDGLLRQAVFHGLRTDKAASQVRREEAAAAPDNGKRRPVRVGEVKVSHPERVIDTASGLSKLDLVRYYEQIAPWMLPYLENRPVYLLRCPDGIDGEQFFQKHANRLRIPGIRNLDPALDPGHAPLMAIDDAKALAGAAQMGAVELHVCNATADRIDRPDCMVFDLDPDPALPWSKVTEGAQLVRAALDELGLCSFLKTGGGKGLHLVVPLARRHDWDTVTAFSQAVAQHLARLLPQQFSARMGERNRIGKIFIDYLRNRRHASTVAPFSARARAGLPVSVPIGWDALQQTSGAAMWTVSSLWQRPDPDAVNPWRDYFATRQALTSAMWKKLGIARK